MEWRQGGDGGWLYVAALLRALTVGCVGCVRAAADALRGVFTSAAYGRAFVVEEDRVRYGAPCTRCKVGHVGSDVQYYLVYVQLRQAAGAVRVVHAASGVGPETRPPCHHNFHRI